MARFRTALDLGVIVRDVRRDRGWTQAELARRAHVGRQWLGALEGGRHDRAELGLVLGVLAALDVELEANAGTDQPTSRRHAAPRNDRQYSRGVDLDELLSDMTIKD